MTNAPYSYPKRVPVIAWAIKKCWITCSSTVCKAPGMDSSWVVSPKPRPRNTHLPARPRTISPPNPCAGRSPPSRRGIRCGNCACYHQDPQGRGAHRQGRNTLHLDIAKIPTLKPAFKKDGTVTAASSSGISDGAAALVLARESFAAAKGLKPLARILGYTSFAREPEWFTVAPVGAMQKLLAQLEWRANDVDFMKSMRRLPR